MSWSEAFAEIGQELKSCDPKSIVFYLCGHAALETAYMYQLFGRMVGSTNFPNSSNMCHESTSVALPQANGVPVGTVILEDFKKTECTVHKLNRSHIIHGEKAFILPCLGRIERDEQATGPQAVTIEDATGCIHASVGHAEPAGHDLLSEPKIVAELAKATLGTKYEVDWDGWVADYSGIRHAMASTYVEVFHDVEKHMWTPGGVHRPLQARVRRWQKTPTTRPISTR